MTLKPQWTGDPKLPRWINRGGILAPAWIEDTTPCPPCECVGGEGPPTGPGADITYCGCKVRYVRISFTGFVNSTPCWGFWSGSGEPRPDEPDIGIGDPCISLTYQGKSLKSCLQANFNRTYTTADITSGGIATFHLGALDDLEDPGELVCMQNQTWSVCSLTDGPNRVLAGTADYRTYLYKFTAQLFCADCGSGEKIIGIGSMNAFYQTRVTADQHHGGSGPYACDGFDCTSPFPASFGSGNFDCHCEQLAEFGGVRWPVTGVDPADCCDPFGFDCYDNFICNTGCGDVSISDLYACDTPPQISCDEEVGIDANATVYLAPIV